METIIAAVITGVLALIGVLWSNYSSGQKMTQQLERSQTIADTKIQQQLEKHQAITDTKIEELTREVREHNNFAKRMPAVEAKIQLDEERLLNLERKILN